MGFLDEADLQFDRHDQQHDTPIEIGFGTIGANPIDAIRLPVSPRPARLLNNG